MLSFNYIFVLLLLQTCISPSVLSDDSASTTAYSTQTAASSTVYTNASTAAPTNASTPSTTPIASTSTTPATTSATTSATTTTTTPATTTPTTTAPPTPHQTTTCYAYPSLSKPCVKLCLGNSERIVLNIQYDDTKGMKREYLTEVPQNTSVAISGHCATATKSGQSLSYIHMQWPVGTPYFYRITFGFKRNDRDMVYSGKTEYKGNWWLYQLKLHYANASYDSKFIDPLLNFSTVSYISNAQPYTNVKYAYYCADELELTLSNASVPSSQVQFSMGEYTVQGFNITDERFSDLHQCNTEDPGEEVVNLIAVGVATGLAALVGVILVAYIAGRIWKRKKQASSYEVLA